jgi:pilus assembly protein CpaC
MNQIFRPPQKLMALLLLGLVNVFGASALLAQDAVRSEQQITLYVGQAHVLNEAAVRRIVVGNGRVVQATALDDKQVLLIPEAPGQSTIHLWNRQNQERHFVINVLAHDTARMFEEVRLMLGPQTNLKPRIVGDRLLLEGLSQNDEQSQRVAEVQKRFPQMVNLVGRVGIERMIGMDVRMVEIKREVLRNIGVKWNGSANGPSFGILGDLHRSSAFQSAGAASNVPGLNAAPRVAPFATSLGLASSITSMLNFLVQNGDAVILAEPRLSCRSGGSARFIAGGELPIPVSTGLGATTVMFKEYGVKFDVNPVANEQGVIAAKIATEISAINFEVMVREVPGLTKRRAETEVNLRENETLVIAGLVTEDSSRSVDKVAGLGELPILGPLFRSRQFRDRVTDLVVFITPSFVTPESDRPEVQSLAREIEPSRPVPAPASGSSPMPAPSIQQHWRERYKQQRDKLPMME